MWSKIRRGIFIQPLLFALLGVVGCGGGSVSSSLTLIRGTLDQNDNRFSDGSVTDFYVATARQNGQATIEMQSSEFDPYLIVSAENSDGEVENIVEDDDSGGNKNARVSFDAEAGKTYFIAALDNSRVDRPGSYTVTLSGILSDVRENPAANLPFP